MKQLDKTIFLLSRYCWENNKTHIKLWFPLSGSSEWPERGRMWPALAPTVWWAGTGDTHHITITTLTLSSLRWLHHHNIDPLTTKMTDYTITTMTPSSLWWLTTPSPQWPPHHYDWLHHHHIDPLITMMTDYTITTLTLSSLTMTDYTIIILTPSSLWLTAPSPYWPSHHYDWQHHHHIDPLITTTDYHHPMHWLRGQSPLNLEPSLTLTPRAPWPWREEPGWGSHHQRVSISDDHDSPLHVVISLHQIRPGAALWGWVCGRIQKHENQSQVCG